jgi:hypothetical protein
MGIVRTAQPVPFALPGLNVTTYGSATAMPFAISNDRKTLYGAANGTGTALYQSTDDGATWTSIATFADNVAGLQETDDGEALVFTQNASSTPGYIYRSTGWATSHSTATWSKKLTTTGGYIRPYWGGGHAFSFGNDKIRAGTSAVGVVNEYGAQTASSTLDSTRATHVYLTTDYGATWTQILDLQVRYPGVFPTHTHGSAYDPYWDRIWVSYGDTGADGVAYARILYSDDRGSTWSPLALPTEWAAIGGFQVTSIAVLRDCLVFGSDDGPGYIRVPRRGYRVAGSAQILAVQAPNTGSQMIANGVHQNRNSAGAPLFMCSQTQSTDAIPAIMVSVDGGATLTRLWHDPALTDLSGKGPITVLGPTYTGKIVSWIGGASAYQILRGELVMPEAGLLDGFATFTGDAVTTVFNIPHGLGVAPTRYMAWPEKPCGSYTLTVTSTNIVVTFGAAPANALALQFGWRAAA